MLTYLYFAANKKPFLMMILRPSGDSFFEYPSSETDLRGSSGISVEIFHYSSSFG
jgi:hypothetical protein